MFACENVLCQIKGKKEEKRPFIYRHTDRTRHFPKFPQAERTLYSTWSWAVIHASQRISKQYRIVHTPFPFFSEHSDVKKTKDLLFHPPCIISRKDEWQLNISCSRKGAIRGGVINYSLFMYVYVKFGEFNSGVWPYVDLFMRLFSCWIKAQLKGWRIFAF